MVSQISVVINTFNEQHNVERLISSLKWADEVVVVDDDSTDGTFETLEKLKRSNRKLRVFQHKSAGFVEPARNFALSKASKEWILILDADEEIPETLKQRLQEIANKMQVDYIRLPRKNAIFGHFMQYSGWWPDYNIRFFRRGKVRWMDQIHRPPKTVGQGLDLPAKEDYAIIHHSYNSISQFIRRMDRYTDIQADELKGIGYKFNWKDLIEKPLNEFLSRFFANEGYKDGLHGLALSFLQAFSFFVVYLKLWEMDKFVAQEISLSDIENQKSKSGQEINYWFKKTSQQGNLFQRIFKKSIC